MSPAWRCRAGVGGLLAALLAASLVSLMAGRLWLPPTALLADGPEGFILRVLRLPRLLAGLGAGAALGLAGALCQSLLRNPLAAPDVIGIGAGAALGALSVLLVLGSQGMLMVAGAGGGALLAGLVVLALARGPRGPDPLRMVLTGIGVSLTAQALVSLLVLRAGEAETGTALTWMVGSLNGRGWPQAALAWAGLVPLGLLAAAGARPLDRLELGDDLARGLGLPVAGLRAGLGLLAVALAALAVAVVGPIGFVAFMAGPIGRAVAGRSGPALFSAALAGALLLTLADLLARLLSPAALLPAGIYTGLMGAPWLLWVLARQIREGRT